MMQDTTHTMSTPIPDEGRNAFRESLSEWIRHTMQNSMRTMHHMCRERGMSVSQMTTLFRMQAHDGLGTSDVGEHLGISNAAASQLLDDLVRRNLVERREDSRDRRVRLHTITDAGRELLHEVKSQKSDWLTALVEAVPPDELDRYTEFMRNLNHIAQSAVPQTCHRKGGTKKEAAQDAADSQIS